VRSNALVSGRLKYAASIAMFFADRFSVSAFLICGASGSDGNMRSSRASIQ